MTLEASMRCSLVALDTLTIRQAIGSKILMHGLCIF